MSFREGWLIAFLDCCSGDYVNCGIAFSDRVGAARSSPGLGPVFERAEGTVADS